MTNDPLAALAGKTISSTEWLNGDILVFHFTEGEDWRMYHEQDCCESVTPCAKEDLSILNGCTITNVRALVSSNSGDSSNDGFTHTTYEIFARTPATPAAPHGKWVEANITWLGTSNGYYSEAVDFRPISAGLWD